jgi:hypothetical protein
MKNKKILHLVLLCFVISGLALGGFVIQKANAQGITLRELLFPSSPIGTTAATEEVLNPLVTQTFDFSTLDTNPASEKNQKAHEQAIELIKKADETYLKPGWLHKQTIYESFPAVKGFFRNGDPIPTKSVKDEWYLIGEDGFVSQAATIDDTGDELTTQKVIFKDGIWKNLTVPESSTTEKEDYQINSLNQSLLNSDSSRNFVYSTNEDADHNLVVYRVELFSEPKSFADQPTEIKGYVNKYTLSRESGITLVHEVFQIYPDDTLVLTDRSTRVVVENVESAPDQIMALIQDEEIK